MKQRWLNLLRNYPLIQRILAVAFTLGVIMLCLPEKSLFKFEYQPNQPWKHALLLAPFDFGVQKTEAEIEAEKALIREGNEPVFSYSPEVSLAVEAEIRSELLLKLETTSDSFALDSMATLLSNRLAFFLETGVLAQHVSLKSLKPIDQIRLDQDGQLRLKRRSEFFTLQSVSDSLRKLPTEDSALIALTRVAIGAVEPNLYYNDSLTQKLLSARLTEVLSVEGKINKGQAIIDKGDLVSEYRLKVLSSLEAEMEQRNLLQQGFSFSVFGEMGIAITLLILLSVYITLNLPSIHNDPRPVTLSMILIGISFAACSLAMNSDNISIYVIPIGIMPLLLRVFYDFRVSIFSFVVLTLLISLFYPNAVEFTITSIVAISVAALYQASSTRRSRILTTALLVFIGYSLIFTFMSLAQNGNLSALASMNYGWFAINALLCTLVFPLVYIVEKIFGYISETTLLELGESKQPLLKELAMKAPGTFQHSLQVANLAEKVAATIGGDPILLRTAAMYHDIGKMNEPQYFIENQLPDHNPHDELEPEESARIIIDHVQKGVELCKAAGIPAQITQFLRTHHGTSKVRYFHRLAEQASGENVDIAKYTYPGPKPFTKETAILMMADSIEAASRSLKKTDVAALDQLVDGIVNYQVNEGQFEEAPITFLEIQEAKRSLKAALRSIYHHRISYD